MLKRHVSVVKYSLKVSVLAGFPVSSSYLDYLGEVKTLVLLFIILKKLLVLTLLEGLEGILKPLLLLPLTTVANSNSSSTDFLALAMTPASDVVGRLT